MNEDINIDEMFTYEEKYEFYELAFLSIKQSFDENLSEAIICQLEEPAEESDEVDDSFYIFLDNTQWYQFLEDAKQYFTETEQYELCADIAELQKKINLSEIITLIKK